jgi:hypothetical protein
VASACGGSSRAVVPGLKSGGPAAHVKIPAPEALAFDGKGDLYVSELQGARVIEITPEGRTTVVAGSGREGYSGDGGPAAAAKLDKPNGIALDGNGGLAIADWGNNAIRKVDAAGKITTIVRSDRVSRPVGVLYHEGDLYIANPGRNSILRLHASGSFSAVTEGVHAAYLAFDRDGNLDLTDFQVNGVSQIDLQSIDSGREGVISRIAGTVTPGFSGDGGPATDARLHLPYGLAVDAAGNVYISDAENNRIRKIDPDGIITTVAGTGARGFSGDGGPATAARLNTPAGLAVDAAGNIYIADQRNNRVRRVDAVTGVITTVAGDGR